RHATAKHPPLVPALPAAQRKLVVDRSAAAGGPPSPGGKPAPFYPQASARRPDHQESSRMTFVSFCSRFGIAVLLVALADFFFYDQPIGITVLLFAIVTPGAV